VSAIAELEKWLASPALSDAEKDELKAVRADAAEVEARFFAPLPFGTAGLRGVCGVGLNRMNRHIIRWTTQAFAEIIAQNGGGEVAVCYDPRHDSLDFARAAAEVFAGNGLRVRIFDDIRPTPELSFAVREYHCAAGVNVTASHNTREYNGYKLYGSYGSQLPPDDASRVAKRMAELDIFADIRRLDFDAAFSQGLITEMGAETDAAFLAAALGEVTDTQIVPEVAERLKIVYTPFHGAGRVLVPEALRRLGVKHLFPVAEQMIPDGDFPTVASPNPENPESFALAVALAERVDADLIIGTDPDSDRIAILVRDSGVYTHISGHKTGVLLLDYLLGARKKAGRLPENAVALKTIVTTDMARAVAESHGAQSFDTFTGFKFMAERKRELEQSGAGKVIFAYEESYGYMIGDFVRDKDAVTAAALLTEMTAHYLAQGKTLLDALGGLYEKLGYYEEAAISLVMPGLDGLRNMQALMRRLRDTPPAEIAGARVTATHDYIPDGSDVLRFGLDDGTAILIRPSGTEPKIKVYVLARGDTKKYAEWAKNLSAAAPE
jgi:phosphoglucomutase